MSFLDIGCPNQNMTNKIYNDYLNLDIKEKYLKKVKDKEGAEAIINSYAKLKIDRQPDSRNQKSIGGR